LFYYVIKQWVEVVGSHCWVSKTYNTVETSLSKDITNFLNNFGEVLGVDFHTSNIGIVGVDFTNQFTSSELNIQIVSKMFESRAFCSVILFMIFASVIRAPCGVDPDVGASGIEDNFESVISITKSDLAHILGVFEVIKGNIIFLLSQSCSIEQLYVVLEEEIRVL